MGKSAFRFRPFPPPAYPDLDRFDQDRRRFLGALGAAVLGTVLLLSPAARAGEDPKKKKPPKKKNDKPRPPMPGGKGGHEARLDERELDRWWAAGSATPPIDSGTR